MTAYFDPDVDRTYTAVYKAETPDILQAFAAFDGAVFSEAVERFLSSFAS